MNLNSSFFISTNGLFDFDFTFLSEAFLFLLLSISVTNLFISPISKQIEERTVYINYNLHKVDILINLAHEEIEKAVKLVNKELKELSRQNNLLKSYIKVSFESEIEKIQKENQKLINRTKASLTLSSMNLFANLNAEINQIAETFFKDKFSFE